MILIDVSQSNIDWIDRLNNIKFDWDLPVFVTISELDTEEKLLAFQAGAAFLVNMNIESQIDNPPIHKLMMQKSEPGNDFERRPLIFNNELIIAPRYRMVIVKGKTISLTRKEFDLLHFFAIHAGQVLSFAQIYKAVWSDEPDESQFRTVRTHISRLQAKIFDTEKKCIQNCWGIGYKFLPPNL